MSTGVVVQAVFGPDGKALTPEEFSALPAPEKAKARERGIRNQALGEGARKERERLANEHTAALKAAEDAYRAAAATAHKAGHAHGYHKAAWQFLMGGIAIGAALTVIVGSTLLLAGSQASVQGVAAGSMVARQNENEDRMRALERNEPYTPGGN